MAYVPFQVLGPTIPTMVGRSGLFRQIKAELAKLTPSHISVIGPKHIGKSVFLKHVADSMAWEEQQFSSVIFWDLAHSFPGSDEDFIQGFCRQLAKALNKSRPDYASMLVGADYSDVKEILEALTAENVRVLMIWDGFDKPLHCGQFSRNLWDQLRELASQPSLRLITATRRSLQELIRHEESVTSDFWNIFGVTLKVGPFEDQDIDDVVSSRAFELEKGARSQLEADSGFVPALTLSLLNAVGTRIESGLVTKQDIADGSDRSLADLEALLASLWDDCNQPTKELYYELLEHEIRMTDASPSLRSALIERGLAQSASAKLWKSCRLMERHVAIQQADRGTLKRQFGTSDVYAPNMRSALELRLAQIVNIDETLRTRLSQCFGYLPREPDMCLKHIRDIADRLVQMLLISELGPNLEIPSDWKLEWQQKEFLNDNYKLPAWLISDRFPRERRDRMQLVGLIVNPRNMNPKSKFCSPLTFEFLQVLKRLGDYGEHCELGPIPLESVLVAVSLSIECASMLTNETEPDAKVQHV